jgi:signal transduction histidine kinase
VKARIVGLIAVEVLLVIVGLWIIDTHPVPVPAPGLVGWAVFVVALVGLTSLPKIYIEHRRHGCWITPADGAILVGLFTLGPLGFVGAVLTAETIIAARFRQAPLKLVFNLVSMLGGYTAAAATFAVGGRVDPLDPVAWTVGLVAMTACALWDMVSTAALFAIAERRPFREMLSGIGPALLLSLVLSAALGLVALVLLHETPFGALLVAPVVAILVVSTRSVTHAQAERNRLERLYGASAKLASVVGRSEALAAIAAEGRTLITGAAAVCAIERPDGSWIGVLVDDAGPQELPAVAVTRLLAATAGSAQGVAELDDGPLDPALPDLPSLVWSTGTADPAVRVLLAVLLDLPADEQVAHRTDVLATFVAHAATVVANVELHEDVQEALDHQVELNRQKGEFVAAVSHELRTPLAGMIGAVQTVQRAHDRMTRDQLAEVLEVGNSQGKRLRSLIEDLLLVAAAEHGSIRIARQDIEPRALVEAITAELPAEIRARVRVDTTDAAALCSDREKIHRIVSNLVDNAHKYAPEGPIDITVRAIGDRIEFTVDDTGPGIAAGDRERIFERFVQLDGSSTRQQGGTGLGLHLCRQLAELLGGQLHLSSSPSGGSRFVLALPRPIGPDPDTPARPGETSESDALVPWSRPPTGIAGSPLRRSPLGTHHAPAVPTDVLPGAAVRTDVVPAIPHAGGSLS